MVSIAATTTTTMLAATPKTFTSALAKKLLAAFALLLTTSTATTFRPSLRQRLCRRLRLGLAFCALVAVVAFRRLVLLLWLFCWTPQSTRQSAQMQKYPMQSVQTTSADRLPLR